MNSAIILILGVFASTAWAQPTAPLPLCDVVQKDPNHLQLVIDKGNGEPEVVEFEERDSEGQLQRLDYARLPRQITNEIQIKIAQRGCKPHPRDCDIAYDKDLIQYQLLRSVDQKGMTRLYTDDVSKTRLALEIVRTFNSFAQWNLCSGIRPKAECRVKKIINETYQVERLDKGEFKPFSRTVSKTDAEAAMGFFQQIDICKRPAPAPPNGSSNHTI